MPKQQAAINSNNGSSRGNSSSNNNNNSYAKFVARAFFFLYFIFVNETFFSFCLSRSINASLRCCGRGRVRCRCPQSLLSAACFCRTVDPAGLKKNTKYNYCSIKYNYCYSISISKIETYLNTKTFNSGNYSCMSQWFNVDKVAYAYSICI